MRLTVSITEAQIARGTFCATGCPVAIGITDALHAAGISDAAASWNPYLDGLLVFRGDDGADGKPVCEMDRSACPGMMYQFALAFDNWYNHRHDPAWTRPSPVEFTLDLPIPA